MKMPTLQMPPAWRDAQERLRAFWQEREARERKLLGAAAVFLLCAFVYALLVNPALAGRAELAQSLPQLRQQAAELQSLVQAATQIAQQAPPPAVPMTRDGIEAALARHNLKAQNLTLSGDMLKVQVTNASFAALMNWLDEQQRAARLSVTEAVIDVQPAIDSVNATLTLRRQAADPSRG